MPLELYSEREIEKIRKASRVVAEVLARVAEMVKPGVSTWDLELEARRLAQKLGAKPAFLGYKPPFSDESYPAALCISVNDEVVHGLPKEEKVLKEGDVVSIDFGAFVDGYAGDAAVTVIAGKGSPEAERLLKATREALYNAIEKALPGNRVGDLTQAIYETARKYGFKTVLRYGGHGVGRKIHQEPFVPNNPKDVGKKNPRLRQGMVVAIEPMLTLSTEETVEDADGWTVRTKDGSLAAHFEHTVAITRKGPIILTEP
ncbi:MAG: type I methionyl aminopeptidase [Aquificae bacterium]|nr:type I methionyl aminopeptidase [Aquificota bacterium]